MINKFLYDALKARYGEVKVSNENTPYTFKVVNGRVIDDCRGEQYTLRCPFCNDKKFRLTVSHANGLKLPGLPKVIWNKINCFNCDFGKKEPTETGAICSLLGLGSVEGIKLRMPTVPLELLQKERPPVEDCGTLAPLVSGSAAYAYVKGRGFDPDVLSKHYNFQRIAAPPEDPTRRFLRDRLYAPMIAKGKVELWQARDVYGNSDISWYTAKNGDKVIFNLDLAREQKYIVITEGIFDALACGFNGVCLLGKFLTSRQLGQLGGFTKPIIVALDPDAPKELDDIYKKLKAQPLLTICKVNYGPDWPKVFNARKNKEALADFADIGIVETKKFIVKTLRDNYGSSAEQLL